MAVSSSVDTIPPWMIMRPPFGNAYSFGASHSTVIFPFARRANR